MLNQDGVLRKLHEVGPRCRRLNECSDQLRQTRQLFDQLDQLAREEPDSHLWPKRRAETANILKDLEQQYALMIEKRDYGMVVYFRSMGKRHRPETLRQQWQAKACVPRSQELERRFAQTLEEYEDLVFEFMATDLEETGRIDEIATFLDIKRTQLDLLVSPDQLQTGRDIFRESHALMVKRVEEQEEELRMIRALKQSAGTTTADGHGA
jgi:hypothetical protein